MNKIISNSLNLIRSYRTPITSEININLMSNKIIKPKSINLGDTIGIFTPSWPAQTLLREKYLHSLDQLKQSGFNYFEGDITRRLNTSGYRSASAKERAEEFMDLIRNPEVKCLMATIGGWNSSSLIPYLDFDEIRENRKIVCGYSDITSLHLSILKYSNLSTLYGPSLVPTFGEYPNILSYSLNSFLNVTTNSCLNRQVIQPPKEYSCQFVDAMSKDWKESEKSRSYKVNDGWKIHSEGKRSGKLIVVNLETLLSLAGTPIFPNFHGKILVIEEEEARFSLQERAFTQLALAGVFEEINALIISKPFVLNNEGADFVLEDLMKEIIGNRPYPVITNFDCGHTFPSISLPIGIDATVEAFGNTINFTIDENFVD